MREFYANIDIGEVADILCKNRTKTVFSLIVREIWLHSGLPLKRLRFEMLINDQSQGGRVPRSWAQVSPAG